MSTATRKDVSLRLNVTPAMHAAILAVAARHDVSVAHVIRRALSAYLQDKGQVAA